MIGRRPSKLSEDLPFILPSHSFKLVPCLLSLVLHQNIISAFEQAAVIIKPTEG